MNNLVLVGFMGTGKDSVAKKIAEKTELTYFSTDKYITIKNGEKIKDIFNKYGEQYFRDIESKTLERIKTLKNTVIATGGGAPLLKMNREILKQTGKIIYLYCNIGELEKRLSQDTERPLLKNEKDMERIFRQRDNLYDFADFKIDNSEKSAEETADLIIKKFKLRPLRKPVLYKKINIRTKSKEYPVLIGENIVEYIYEYLEDPKKKEERLVIISDSLVSTLFVDKITRILEQKFKILHLTIEEGEANKNLDTIKKIYDFLFENKITRDDFLISIGGGITGDMVGFAASTFKRGMKYIRIPTTLLAQIDASIGGKTGINHREGKNMIGSFYQPEIILTDISFLKTLPDSIFSSGLAEVIKYGIIKDYKLFSILEKNNEKIIKRETKTLLEIISRSIKIKGKIVEKDEKEELGIREILNFGHTIGHIIESETDYRRFSHGEAVAIGMIKEIEIAHKKGFIDKKGLNRIKKIVSLYGLPTSFPPKLSDKILYEKISQDKKVRGRKIKVPIPYKIGKTIVKEVLCENYL